MKRGSTLFLKIAVILIGIPVLAFCIVGLPWLVNHPVNPIYAHILYPIVIGMCVTVIPYFFALYQAYRLLTYIDKNETFSALSVKALKKIKYSAFTISAVYVVLLPFIFMLAEKDDAPGLVLFGMVIVFAALVIAVFAAVLQKLLINAVNIKSENDLTV